MRRNLAAWAAVWAATIFGTAHGAEPDADSEVVRLSITPAVEPVSALKYQLLPRFIDQRPGNAALDYGRAMLELETPEKFDKRVNDWLKLSPVEFDAAAKAENIAQHLNKSRMDLARLGARCERCDWQPPLRDQNPFFVLLPECQGMRDLARMVIIEARLKLSAGKHDEALDLLQTAYAMARHIADEPTLVNGLVGLSIATMADELLLDFAQRPDAPSLYWALTFMPTPLVDRRRGLEAEMYCLPLMFPIMQDEVAQTDEEFDAAALKFFNALPGLANLAVELPSETSVNGAVNTAVILTKTVLRRDELREFLVRCGEDEARVKKMSDARLLIRFTRLKYDEIRDRLYRYMLLPYHESREALLAAEKELKRSAAEREEIIPFAALLLPAITTVNTNYAKADRRHDALRIIEALRLYAGSHDGALPKSLADVTDVPLPKVDAVTGAPFEYVLDGDTARLSLPHERGHDGAPRVFEITVAK